MANPDPIKKTVPEYVEEAVSAVLQSVPFTGGLAKYLDTYFPSQQKLIE